MIEKITFGQYRKLKNIEFNFSETINVISGTNGTCKSTLMHLISNSFQSLRRNSNRLSSAEPAIILNRFTEKVNPKVESISRGDKATYNNPAKGVAGTLFTVKYIDGDEIGFRKHNSNEETKQSNFRFAIKPQYGKSKKDSLPEVPIVYLSLSRLFPYGELSDAHEIQKPRGQLPDHLHTAFIEQYERLTNLEIVQALNQNVSGVKKRSDFSTKKEGIDSNTISSGEDNISIILTALNCLRNICENVRSEDERNVESILLIDEFDATLHPSAQALLLDEIEKYSVDYRIQVFFTTHSLYLLKHSYQKKHNISYLIDQVDEVALMKDPSPAKIEMHLDSKLKKEIYKNVFIPVYTEDAEARMFLTALLNYIAKDLDSEFAKAKVFLHLVEANIGSESLKNLFSDKILNQSSMRSICILDGDMNKNLSDHIIVLPGSKNPEALMGGYAQQLCESNDYKGFWDEAFEYGYSKIKCKPIIDEFLRFEKIVDDLKQNGDSTKGVLRSISKKHFNQHKDFYSLVLGHWVANPANQSSIKSFMYDLHSVFHKTLPFHSIESSTWILQKEI